MASKWKFVKQFFKNPHRLSEKTIMHRTIGQTETTTGMKELFHKYRGNPILTVEDWSYPANSVFNAGAVQIGERTLLLVRVEDKRGRSHLCAAWSKDGTTDWQIDPEPTLYPDAPHHPEEIWGIEDPRITYLNDLGEYVIAYTAWSKAGPLVSLATTKDFRTFNRIGPALPPDNKDAAVFPVQFDGKWAMIHRPSVSATGAVSWMWISFSHDLKYWGEHYPLMPARHGGWWDADKIGLSTPPMETSEGWLILYHGVRNTASGCLYRCGLALLDLENPTKVIHRSDEWVLAPDQPYERTGDVGGVVFPCGWVLQDGTIRVYYGAADTYVAMATANLSELLDYITNESDG